MLHDVNSGWLTRLPCFHRSTHPFRRLHGASDSLLNEVSGEVGFLSEFLVERVSCRRIRGDAVRVRLVVPTEFGGTVRAVKELSGGFVEVVAVLIGNDEFDRRSSAYLHVSERVCGYLLIGSRTGLKRGLVRGSSVGSLSDLLVRFAHSLRTEAPPRNR